MYSYDPFMNNAGVFIGTINNLLFGLVVGLYASLAYISWEALARSQSQKQVNLVDALWQRNFFLSETGAALIHGVALGGIVIGMMSVLSYAFGVVLIQADSQFGFAEAGITPKVLTMNMSAWTTTWLVTTGQIGFIYSLLKNWIKKDWLVSVLSVILIGISISVLGRLIGTNGTIWQDVGIYTGIAILFAYAIKEHGLLSVSTAWWTFTVFFLTLPYMGADSIEISYVAWGQYILMAGVLVYGFVIYRFGTSVTQVEEYIPEYEERIAQHLRVEKEIEIARESQYKLMPLQPPISNNFDVYGFFMPSFEVGGDYFDYIMAKDENGNASSLTMTIVDVSGKSMRAAMPAVFTSGLLLSRIKHDCPDEILSDITEPLFDRTDKRTFITCVLARLDIESQKLAIANAGHCRPILKRNGIAEYIHTPKPSYPLGMQRHVQYGREVLNVKKGDFFLLYSDGLPEAVNEKGERFGFDEVPRLIESIDTDNLSAKEISQEIKRTVQKFSNYQLADDTTIICLKL
jgi:serine phosphatase RsbU (regulator of sigma subunit)